MRTFLRIAGVLLLFVGAVLILDAIPGVYFMVAANPLFALLAAIGGLVVLALAEIVPVRA